MKTVYINIFLVFIVLLAIVNNVWSVPILTRPDDPFEGVEELNEMNFDSFVSDPEKHVIIEVYAPWCHFCKRFVKCFKTLGKLVSTSIRSSDVKLGKLDGDRFEGLANRLKVEGFPTILLFKKGTTSPPVEYEMESFEVKPMLDWLHSEINDNGNQIDGSI